MDTYAGGWNLLLVALCECISISYVYGKTYYNIFTLHIRPARLYHTNELKLQVHVCQSYSIAYQMHKKNGKVMNKIVLKYYI